MMAGHRPAPPSASLVSRYLRGGLWDIRHVLSTYCVPGIVFDTSPHGRQTDNAFKARKNVTRMMWNVTAHWVGRGYLDHVVRKASASG